MKKKKQKKKRRSEGKYFSDQAAKKQYAFSKELGLTRLVFGEQTQEEVSSFEPVHD